MTDSATWICLTNEQLSVLWACIGRGVIPDGIAPDQISNLQETICLYQSAKCKDQRYRDAAAELDFVRDGECEIDDHAVVSKGDDPGAYVMAWVWVDDEDAGVENDD